MASLDRFGLGLTDIIAVASGDAVFLAHKSRAQDVKQAVDILRQKNLAQADQFTLDHRPWGSFDRLASGERFQVKQIHVKPGAKLSLQSHHRRSERLDRCCRYSPSLRGRPNIPDQRRAIHLCATGCKASLGKSRQGSSYSD